MGSAYKTPALACLAVLGLSALSGCVDEKIVYRDRDLFEEPLAEAASFLGYSDQADGLTVCGNCHIGPQAEWEATAHADAWAGLQDSGHAQAFCEGCHTVNELGNTVTDAAGFLATGEERYHDVQCESCHGPGSGARGPDPTRPRRCRWHRIDRRASTTTLRLRRVPSVARITRSRSEWESVERTATSTSHAYPQSRESCEGCHTGEGALEAFGIKTIYAEFERRSWTIRATTSRSPARCATTRTRTPTNPGQLRFPVGRAVT